MKKIYVKLILVVICIFMSIGIIRLFKYDKVLKRYNPKKLGGISQIPQVTLGSSLGISLLENGNIISYRNYSNEKTDKLFTNLVYENEKFHLGKIYKEELSVKNSGSVDQYLRVSIYKYWLDSENKKDLSLQPNLINLNLVNTGENWIIDEKVCTNERTVLYYSYPLEVGEETLPFTDTFSIDSSIKTSVEITVTSEYSTSKTIKTIKKGEGKRAVIEVQVESIQTHNAEDGILSAWGRKVKIDENGRLILID